jgi:hypothetical protein
MSEMLQYPQRIRKHDIAECSSEASFSKLWQAWTALDVDEALRDPDFLSPIAWTAIEAGDTVEIFEVYPEHLDCPETDPIAVASVVIRSVTVDRNGRHVNFMRNGETLRFNGAAGEGVYAEEWNGKLWTYIDGKRDRSFRTKIELGERAEELRKGAAA